MSIQISNLDTAAKRTFDHGQINSAEVAGMVVGRAVFNPGWKWSVDVAPSAGTSMCQVAHVGVVLSGQFHVRMVDGTEAELHPGDAHVIPPGHDAWVVGDEQCVIVDFQPVSATGV